MDRPAKESHPPFGGYHQTATLDPDSELTHVGPGMPGGEYLRRFWHSVEHDREVPLDYHALFSAERRRAFKAALDRA